MFTFVLFTGIVCGHFGLTGNTQILTFLQDFGANIVRVLYRTSGRSFFFLFLQERRDCNESSSNGDCRIEYCCGCGFVLWLERPDRAAYEWWVFFVVQ